MYSTCGDASSCAVKLSNADFQNNLIIGDVSSSEVNPSLLTARSSSVVIDGLDSSCTNDPQTLRCEGSGSIVVDGSAACGGNGKSGYFCPRS